jgi:hypothetical protein
MTNKKIMAIEVNYLTNILSQAEDWEDFISLWLQTKEFEQSVQWLKGDIACKIAIKYGEKSLIKFAQETNESYQTIIAYRRVSKAFDFNKRLLNLTWSHYFIASQTDKFLKGSDDFETNNRFDWLNKAHDNQWGARRLAEEIKSNNALANNTETQFSLYLSYIEKFCNMVTHWELKNLSKQQLRTLETKINETYNKFSNKVKTIS